MSMIPLDYRSTPPVDIARAEIAGKVAEYLAAGGEIHVIPGIEQRLDQPYKWNRNDLVLPGSSPKTLEQNKEKAIARRIKAMADKGSGVTSMKLELHLDASKIKRIALRYGITIPNVRVKKPNRGELTEADREKLRQLAETL